MLCPLQPPARKKWLKSVFRGLSVAAALIQLCGLIIWPCVRLINSNVTFTNILKGN